MLGRPCLARPPEEIREADPEEERQRAWDGEEMLELDEALAGGRLQGPARGEWGWEWGWATSDLQDPDWDSEEVPAVSDPRP